MGSGNGLRTSRRRSERWFRNRHKTSQSRDSDSPSSRPDHITNPYECYWPKIDTRSVKPLAGSRGGSAIIPRGPPFAQAPEDTGSVVTYTIRIGPGASSMSTWTPSTPGTCSTTEVARLSQGGTSDELFRKTLPAWVSTVTGAWPILG